MENKEQIVKDMRKLLEMLPDLNEEEAKKVEEINELLDKVESNDRPKKEELER